MSWIFLRLQIANHIRGINAGKTDLAASAAPDAFRFVKFFNKSPMLVIITIFESSGAVRPEIVSAGNCSKFDQVT
jgi:hypothetical protein